MKGMTWLLVMAVLAASVSAAGCGREGETEAAAKPTVEETRVSTQAEAAAPALEAEDVESVMAQKVCPVMGRPIDKDIYLGHEGRRVYFCCQSCVAAFKKDPGKYLAKLDEQAE